MCVKCQALIKAIDAYIEKADEDLADELDVEGFLVSKKTLETAQEIEDEIAGALVDETNYILDSMSDSVDLEAYVAQVWGDVKLNDVFAEKARDVFVEDFTEFMPTVVEAYLQKTDQQLTYIGYSKATADWITSWSGELSQKMQLTSHDEIEKILTKAVKNGDSIATVTQDIRDSGIRNEYYRARRVAVTEVLRAHSVAQQEAFMQSPSVTKKMWRHTGSYKNEPRPNHEDMDGQLVDVDQPFELIGADGVLYEPMYPRDASLPPGESVNCHCLTEPIVDEEILGFTLEERQAMQQEALDSLDADWEEKFNEENKKKAGIEET